LKTRNYVILSAILLLCIDQMIHSSTTRTRINKLWQYF